MPIKPQPAPAEQQSPYVPAGPTDPLIFEKFEGINTATTRPGVDDKECAWLDGFMPLGPNRNLRTMYGIGADIFTASGSITVVFFDFINIGATPFAIVFTSDGAIYSVNMTTFAVNVIAVTGTITNPSQLNIGIAGYGSQFALIVAKQTNGYFIWDGTTFYIPGGSGPVIDGAPTTMPLAVGGTAIEVYTGRVWIANGAVITFSAPGSVVDFSSGDGGGNFTSTDSFLRVGFTSLKQTNGFLYLIADSSVNYISSVQTSGSPPVTTFTNQNADPEVGTPWPNTVDVFNRNILFANAFGAHVSYGGAVTKISDKLDGVYNTVPNFGNFTPSAAKAIIFGKKCYILLLPIIDPISGQQVNKLFLYRQAGSSSTLWWASSQDTTLTYIQFQEINSVITAWGTDGTHIFQLFAQPSGAFTKIAQSKLWDTPGGYQFVKATSRLWAMVQYYAAIEPGLSISIDNESGSAVNDVSLGPTQLTWTNNFGTLTWSNVHGAMTWFSFNLSSIIILPPQAVAQQGVLTGLTMQTNAGDMAIISAMIWDDIVQYRG